MESVQDPSSFQVILCGASAYDRKYYFNEQFDRLPESIKEELHIMCVLFTEEIGGVFTVGFNPYGEVELSTQCDEGDLLYDDIGCGLMIKKLRREKEELFESLSIYFKVTYLHQDPAQFLDMEDDPGDTEGGQDE